MLGFAALDGVVLEAIAEGVPVAAQRGLAGDALGKWISSTPGPIVQGIAAGDPAAGLAEVVRLNIGHTTFQRAAMIEGVLRDSIGSEPPWLTAAERLSRVSEDNWEADEIRTYLDEFVDRRNSIAHNGDRSPGRRAADPIQYWYVETAVELARAVGRSVCLVVERRINSVLPTST